MMSFWTVPWSLVDVGALLLGGGDVEGEEPGGGGVDRHRGVHRLERDAVEERAHVAEVGDGDADLADLAAGEGVVAVVAGLGGQVEGDREAGLAAGEVRAVERVRGGGGGMAGVGAEEPGLVAGGFGHSGPPARDFARETVAIPLMRKGFIVVKSASRIRRPLRPGIRGDCAALQRKPSRRWRNKLSRSSGSSNLVAGVPFARTGGFGRCSGAARMGERMRGWGRGGRRGM